jgi:hypothetical protein
MVPFRLNHPPLAAWTVNHSDITAPQAGSGQLAQFPSAMSQCNRAVQSHRISVLRPNVTLDPATVTFGE